MKSTPSQPAAPGPMPLAAEEAIQYASLLTTAAGACCCGAQPVVVAVLPPTAARAQTTELLLCGHHYRAAGVALTRAHTRVFDRDGVRVIPGIDLCYLPAAAAGAA